MEYEKIKQLMDDFGNSKLNSIDIDFPDGTKISMKKDDEKKVVNATNNLENMVEENAGQIENNEENNSYKEKNVPNSAPYVEVGTTVKKGDILCIIEAMKLMNEIESEFDGEIKEILVKDGEPVEYGKPLFVIK